MRARYTQTIPCIHAAREGKREKKRGEREEKGKGDKEVKTDYLGQKAKEWEQLRFLSECMMW